MSALAAAETSREVLTNCLSEDKPDESSAFDVGDGFAQVMMNRWQGHWAGVIWRMRPSTR